MKERLLLIWCLRCRRSRASLFDDRDRGFNVLLAILLSLSIFDSASILL